GVEPDCALLEIACNLDTASGEHLGWLLERAFERGAVDAWLTPVTMKKGRPGQVFTVLAPAERRAELCAFLLEESTSLGVRLSPVAREVLERWEETREGPLGAVRFKCARLPSGAVVCRREAAEVARLCAAHGLTRREVEERLRGGAAEAASFAGCEGSEPERLQERSGRGLLGRRGATTLQPWVAAAAAVASEAETPRLRPRPRYPLLRRSTPTEELARVGRDADHVPDLDVCRRLHLETG